MMKDTAGMLISGLCLVHCLATPLLLALGGAGVLGTVLEGEFFHLALLGPVLLLALYSFPAACRHHRRPAVMISGLSGLLILVLALGLEGRWELFASAVGACLLIGAHWRNRRLLQAGAAVRERGDATV
ncbi:MerC domain-containing protein [Microbulbifer litoralis]|uniref:MerC domain-containing protein n=1 Tax=Microbulbifer litoralis TaxID=2933965 RepID=UPI0020299209|nr:MerC domain-containing protein [Microbulbifer sp. GX H0434]